MNAVHTERYNFRNESKGSLTNETLAALIKTKIIHDCVYFGGDDNTILYVPCLTDENMDFLNNHPDKFLKFTISEKRNSIIINILKE